MTEKGVLKKYQTPLVNLSTFAAGEVMWTSGTYDLNDFIDDIYGSNGTTGGLE